MLDDEPITRPHAGGVEPEKLERLLTHHRETHLEKHEIAILREIIGERNYVKKQAEERARAEGEKKERSTAWRGWISIGIAVCIPLLSWLVPLVAKLLGSPAPPK